MVVQEPEIGNEFARRSRCAARAGWTLIELLVVMSLSAGLSGLAITMLAGVLRANSHDVARIADEAATFRLAERFRADIAAASQCRPIDAAQPQSGIVLQSADGSRVEYVPAAVAALERIAYAGQEINRRETYQLGQSRHVILQIGQESPTVVTCVLDRSTTDLEPNLAENRNLAITAILGSDARFGHAVANSTEKQPAEPPATPSDEMRRKPESRDMIRSKSHYRSSGVVLVIVLVCLAIAAALVVNWARVGILQARQARSAEDRLQAVWLAESALGRAAARLNTDPDYQGEIWEISALEMGPRRRLRAMPEAWRSLKLNPLPSAHWRG